MNRKEIICRGDELFRLIPQRPPMVMIDRFYGIEENTSWSGLTVTPDNLFCRDGVLQETGIIEHIAQSAAARVGYINIRNSYFLHYFYYFYFMRDKVKHYSCFQYLKSIFLIGHDAYYDDYRN